MRKMVIAFSAAVAALVLSGCAYDRGYYDSYYGGYYDGDYYPGYYGSGYYGPSYYYGYDYYGYAPGYYGSVYWDRHRRHHGGDHDRHDGHWGDRGDHDRDSHNRDRDVPNGWDTIRGRSSRSGYNRDASNSAAAAPRVQSLPPVSGRDTQAWQPQSPPRSGAPSQSRSRDTRNPSDWRNRISQP